MVNGAELPNAEHNMMWRKAMLFGDTGAGSSSRRIHIAKALGPQVRGFDEQVWSQQRYGMVVAGSLAKFGRHSWTSYISWSYGRMHVDRGQSLQQHFHATFPQVIPEGAGPVKRFGADLFCSFPSGCWQR